MNIDELDLREGKTLEQIKVSERKADISFNENSPQISPNINKENI